METIFWVQQLVIVHWLCVSETFGSHFILLLVVDEANLGKSKAKCVCSFVQELNDAVKAKFVEESPETLIETNPSFFSQFTLGVATQVCYYISYEINNWGFLCKHDCVPLFIILIFCVSFSLK